MYCFSLDSFFTHIGYALFFTVADLQRNGEFCRSHKQGFGKSPNFQPRYTSELIVIVGDQGQLSAYGLGRDQHVKRPNNQSIVFQVCPNGSICLYLSNVIR